MFLLANEKTILFNEMILNYYFTSLINFKLHILIYTVGTRQSSIRESMYILYIPCVRIPYHRYFVKL